MHRIPNRILTLLRALCPAEIFLVLLILASGVVSLTHLHRLDPISLLLPHWVSIAWNIALVVGASLSLAGLLFLNWLLVRLGYTLLGPAAAAYAVALLPYATVLSIRINVATLFAFALACLWRSLQITFTIRRSG